MSRYLFAVILLMAPAFGPFSSALPQTSEGPEAASELARSFETFLQVYRHEIKRRNGPYLKSLHPKLPEEMHDFFFDVTLQMMRFSEEQGLRPTVECQEFKVCKVVYPQPNDSWAAQRFILYENSWRWLDQ